MPKHPAADEVFTLTIARPFTGLDTVRDDGFKKWPEWKFIGHEISEPRIGRFKLVTLGRCVDFDMVKLASLSAIP